MTTTPRQTRAAAPQMLRATQSRTQWLPTEVAPQRIAASVRLHLQT